jgi:hypothetical protein
MISAFLWAALMAGADSARYEQWAKERRIDLCAEAIIQCRDDKQAERMADLLLPLRKRPFPEILPRGLKIEYFGPVFKVQPWERKPAHYKGESVFVPVGVYFTLVRADRCTVQEINRASYFVAVRDGIAEQFRVQVKDYIGEWYRSVVIVGSSASVPRVYDSLIVCDGDLKVTHDTGGAVIIANGNIEATRSNNGSKFYAAGRIKTPKADQKGRDQFHEFGKDMPVRFLDLGEDLGLRVTDKLVLEADWRGLRKGDIITKIDGAAVDSIPLLRKQLRRGIVRWSATVEARRGNESISRVVCLDLNSIPVAPQPREVKK